MFWPPVRGDASNQTERWALAGVTASNSDQGRLFAVLTATTLILYSDRDLTASVAEVSGGHGAPSTWTRKSLVALNASGVTGSVYLKYSAADAIIEIYALLATDAELSVLVPGFDKWPYQTGQTTFENQHKKTREDFIGKLLLTQPPLAGGRRTAAAVAAGSDAGTIWRVNSIGDFEVRRLQNVWSYRNWALWYTMAMICRQNRYVLEEADQIALLDEAEENAEKAWSEAQVLIDAGEDLDADEEIPRYTVSRG